MNKSTGPSILGDERRLIYSILTLLALVVIGGQLPGNTLLNMAIAALSGIAIGFVLIRLTARRNQ